MNNDLISREALENAKPEFMNEKVTHDTKYRTTKDRIYAKAWNACNSCWLDTIKMPPTVSVDSCRDCSFVADEEKQITKGDAWRSYCEGQEVGFKKAEDVFERMKLVQGTVDCIRYTFNQDLESHKLVRNCMALVQNAIDGEYHDMEDVDVSELDRPKSEWVGNAFDEHHCKRCGHPALWEEEPDGYYEVQSRFCPNCGADMRKGGAE